MKNAKMINSLSVLAACLLTTSVYATPVELSNAQMDSVSGGTFVCPVISTDAVLNSPKAAEPQAGFYTILGPNVSVPVGATNTLNDGTSGTPGGTFASPGDTGYTAIWN